MTAASCASARLVDLHFSLRISPAEERELRSHLERCDVCRERYQRQLLVARLDPTAAPAEDRLARALGLPHRSARRPWLTLIAAAVAAAAALAFWPRPDADFAARGAAASLPAVVVYRVDASGASRPAGQSIAPSDELAFAYRNPQGRKFMMIFGVDEHGHVYWYHPAWTDPSRDPIAVPIQTATDPIEMQEAISHRLDGRQLTLHALLLDEALGVRELEDRIARGVSPLAPGARDEKLQLEVRR
jgi:hypothetical protein